MTDLLKLLKRPAVIIRCLELVICAICVVICSGERSLVNTWAKAEVLQGTFIGFLMVGTVVIIAYLVDTPISSSVMRFVSCAGAIMFLTSGALLVDSYINWLHSDRVIAAGSAALVNCIVYLIDAVLTHRAMDSF